MCFPKWNLTLITARKTTSNILNITYYNKASFLAALIAPASAAALCSGFGFTAVQEAGESVCLGISPSPHTPVSLSPYTRLPLLSRPCVLQQGPGADASPLGTHMPEPAVPTRGWATLAMAGTRGGPSTRGATAPGWWQARTRGPRSPAGGKEQRDIPFFPPHMKCSWLESERKTFLLSSFPRQHQLCTHPLYRPCLEVNERETGRWGSSLWADLRISLHLLLAVSLFCNPWDASVRQSPRDFYLLVTTSILQNGETEGRFSELFHVTKSPVTAAERGSHPQLQSLNQLSCHRGSGTKKAEYNNPSWGSENKKGFKLIMLVAASYS